MTQQLAEVVRPQQTQMPAAYFPTDGDWKMMLDFGNRAYKSGLLPAGVKSGEMAAIIALKGREIGIPFMQAMSHIHVINGKPSQSAELMIALARKNLPGLVINILTSDSKAATIEFIRPEKGAKGFTMSFSIEDAERAKLLGKDVWKQYPAAMLWSRCVSAGLRKVCPEALMGVSYTPEELGAPVDGEGNVIETTGRKVDADKKPEPPKGHDEKQFAMNRVMALMVELNISADQMSEVVFKEFAVKSSRDLSVGQAQQLAAMLEEQRSIREQAAASIGSAPIQQPEQADWEKDL